MTQLSEQAQNLLQLIPESGSIGNVTLRRRFSEIFPPGIEIADPDFFSTPKSELLAAHLISLGRGKGGSVRRAISTYADLNLETGQIIETLESKPRPESGQTETAAVAATEEF